MGAGWVSLMREDERREGISQNEGMTEGERGMSDVISGEPG